MGETKSTPQIQVTLKEREKKTKLNAYKIAYMSLKEKISEFCPSMRVTRLKNNPHFFSFPFVFNALACAYLLK